MAKSKSRLIADLLDSIRTNESTGEITSIDITNNATMETHTLTVNNDGNIHVDDSEVHYGNNTQINNVVNNYIMDQGLDSDGILSLVAEVGYSTGAGLDSDQIITLALEHGFLTRDSDDNWRAAIDAINTEIASLRDSDDNLQLMIDVINSNLPDSDDFVASARKASNLLNTNVVLPDSDDFVASAAKRGDLVNPSVSVSDNTLTIGDTVYTPTFTDETGLDSDALYNWLDAAVVGSGGTTVTQAYVGTGTGLVEYPNNTTGGIAITFETEADAIAFAAINLTTLPAGTQWLVIEDTASDHTGDLTSTSNTASAIFASQGASGDWRGGTLSRSGLVVTATPGVGDAVATGAVGGPRSRQAQSAGFAHVVGSALRWRLGYVADVEGVLSVPRITISSTSSSGGSGTGLDSDGVISVVGIPYANLTGTPTIPTDAIDSERALEIVEDYYVAGDNVTFTQNSTTPYEVRVHTANNGATFLRFDFANRAQRDAFVAHGLGPSSASTVTGIALSSTPPTTPGGTPVTLDSNRQLVALSTNTARSNLSVQAHATLSNRAFIQVTGGATWGNVVDITATSGNNTIGLYNVVSSNPLWFGTSAVTINDTAETTVSIAAQTSGLDSDGVVSVVGIPYANLTGTPDVVDSEFVQSVTGIPYANLSGAPVIPPHVDSDNFVRSDSVSVSGNTLTVGDTTFTPTVAAADGVDSEAVISVVGIPYANLTGTPADAIGIDSDGVIDLLDMTLVGAGGTTVTLTEPVADVAPSISWGGASGDHVDITFGTVADAAAFAGISIPSGATTIGFSDSAASSESPINIVANQRLIVGGGGSWSTLQQLSGGRVVRATRTTGSGHFIVSPTPQTVNYVSGGFITTSAPYTWLNDAEGNNAAVTLVGVPGNDLTSTQITINSTVDSELVRDVAVAQGFATRTNLDSEIESLDLVFDNDTRDLSLTNEGTLTVDVPAVGQINEIEITGQVTLESSQFLIVRAYNIPTNTNTRLGTLSGATQNIAFSTSVAGDHTALEIAEHILSDINNVILADDALDSETLFTALRVDSNNDNDATIVFEYAATNPAVDRGTPEISIQSGGGADLSGFSVVSKVERAATGDTTELLTGAVTIGTVNIPEMNIDEDSDLQKRLWAYSGTIRRGLAEGTNTLAGPGGTALGTNSQAWGVSTNASGTLSQAYGINVNSRGTASASIGRNIQNSGVGAGAVGGNIIVDNVTAGFAIGGGLNDSDLALKIAADRSINIGYSLDRRQQVGSTSVNTIMVGIDNQANGDSDAVIYGHWNTVNADARRVTAIGFDNEMSGFESQAFGIRNIAIGTRAGIIGRDNIAQGDVSGAVGSNNHVYGVGVFALGTGNRLGDSDNGDHVGTVRQAFVVGLNNRVYDSEVELFGRGNLVEGGQNAIVFGRNNNVYSPDATVLGNANDVHSGSQDSFIYGDGNDVEGSQNNIIGRDNTVRGDNIFALGRLSDIRQNGVYVGNVTVDSDATGENLALSPGVSAPATIRGNVMDGMAIGLNADVGDNTTGAPSIVRPIAIGSYSHARHTESIAFGPYAVTDSDFEIRIGGNINDAFSGSPSVDTFVTVRPSVAGTETRDHQLVTKRYVDDAVAGGAGGASESFVNDEVAALRSYDSDQRVAGDSDLMDYVDDRIQIEREHTDAREAAIRTDLNARIDADSDRLTSLEANFTSSANAYTDAREVAIRADFDSDFVQSVVDSDYILDRSIVSPTSVTDVPVGSLVYARWAGTTEVTYGSTISVTATDNLRPDSQGTPSPSEIITVGTWRCLGYRVSEAVNSNAALQATMWQRIS